MVGRKSGVIGGGFLVVATIGMLGNAGGRAATAGRGNTGAFGEQGQTCVNCHNGGAYGPILELLEVTTAGGQLVASYTPGTTYNVEYTVMENQGNPSGFGFQLIALDDNNHNNAGTFENLGANVKESVAQNTANRKYLENKGGASATGVFTAKWTAPAANTGSVTMYYAGTVVNGNGAKTLDNGSLGSSITLNEGGAGGLPLPYYQNFQFGPGGWTSLDVPATGVASWAMGAQPATLWDPEAWGASGGVGAGPGGLAYLLLPRFDCSSATGDPVISFWIHYDTEFGDAGGWLETSIDGGQSWFKVGVFGGGGWYDSSSLMYGDMWSGQSQGWMYLEHALDGTAGYPDVQARVVFTSETAASLDVLGIDDVAVDFGPGDPPGPPPGGTTSGGDSGSSDDGYYGGSDEGYYSGSDDDDGGFVPDMGS